MNRKKRYHDLMERIRDSHQEFSAVWNRVKAEELRKRGLEPGDDIWIGDRMEKVWEANGVAYQAARPQSDRRDEFLTILFDELPFEEFLEDKPEAIDAILDFLEIDVLAFRCGYAKQWCFHNLKSLTLNQKQKMRLQQLTIAMCQYKGQREELRELARLMIPLADTALIQQLHDLAESGDNEYVRRKAERVLKVVLNSRHDLK
jgi:hypothetical protein